MSSQDRWKRGSGHNAGSGGGGSGGVGNRRGSYDQRIPPDDIGNRVTRSFNEMIPHDDVGNSLAGAATHLITSSTPVREKRQRGGGRSGAHPTYQRPGFSHTMQGGHGQGQSQSQHSGLRGSSQESGGGFERLDRGERGGRLQDRRRGGERSGGGDRNQMLRRGPLGDAGKSGGQNAPMGQSRRSQDPYLRKLFHFGDEDESNFSLKSTPEVKQQVALEAVRKILTHMERNAEVDARLLTGGNHGKPELVLLISESAPANGVKMLMDNDGTSLALNFLVNKIVNRYPDDRIKLSVMPWDEGLSYIEQANVKAANAKAGSGGLAAPSVSGVDLGSESALAPQRHITPATEKDEDGQA
jgi:hypothetical protein